MRRFLKFVAGRVQGSGGVSSDACASTRPAANLSFAALDAAIAAATFSRRSPAGEGDEERIVVMCNQLGGSLYYSRAEFNKRLAKYFPGLNEAERTNARQMIESRIGAYLVPFKETESRRSSYVDRWRHDQHDRIHTA